MKRAVFVLAGAAAGCAYHFLVGCSTGACPLTANPVGSTLYGAVIGLILSSGGKPDRKS